MEAVIGEAYSLWRGRVGWRHDERRLELGCKIHKGMEALATSPVAAERRGPKGEQKQGIRQGINVCRLTGGNWGITGEEE